jgi:hypothetical protein
MIILSMPARNKTTADRFLALTLKLVLQCLKHFPWLSRGDLSLILTNHTESILNLPGRLPFVPTRVTEETLVRALIRKLHPINCSKQLIRIGPKGDGGYLVPDDLEGITACFSPGVSDIAGFELDCAERGMEVYMADASVQRPPIDHPRFNFSRKFLGALTQGDFISLEDWVHTATGGSGSDLLLQMDIEGYEYETILGAPKALLQRFRIVVIEFHYLEYLFSDTTFTFYARTFEKLLSTHTCVHIHPNNFCQPMMVKDFALLQMAEFTFLRNDRVSDASFATTFPHPLDQDNTTKAQYGLPASFYNSRAAATEANKASSGALLHKTRDSV